MQTKSTPKSYYKNNKTVKKSNKEVMRNKKTVKNINNKTSNKKKGWKSEMKNGKSIDTILLDIFRKEGGDANNCPKSITLEMLACATAAGGWNGKKDEGMLNDAGILVRNNAIDALWYSYYTITLSSLLHNNTSDFGKYFTSRGIYDYEEVKPDQKIYTKFEFDKAAPVHAKPNKIKDNKGYILNIKENEIKKI